MSAENDAGKVILAKRITDDVSLPVQMSGNSAGFDLKSSDSVTIKPGARILVGTGIRLAIPEGMEGQVRPRSGLALKYGVTVLNAPGTIDSDYRGEVGVILINHGDEDFEVTKGMRIAQIVFAAVEKARIREVDSLPHSARGTGGFGSTGK